MQRPFSGNGIPKDLNINSSNIKNDSYYKMVNEILERENILDKFSIEDTHKLQSKLLYPYLEFFVRNEKNDFYKKLFYSGRIETTLVELVRLRLANVHGCAFCNKGDTAHALKSGITQMQINELDNYLDGPFSDREKLALELGDEMVLTNKNGYVGKDLYDRLKTEFSDGEIYELGMIMAVLVGVAKFTFVFDLVEKEEYCIF